MRGHIQTSHVDHGFQLSTLNSLKTTGDFNLKFYDQEVDFQLFTIKDWKYSPVYNIFSNISIKRK